MNRNVFAALAIALVLVPITAAARSPFPQNGDVARTIPSVVVQTGSASLLTSPLADLPRATTGSPRWPDDSFDQREPLPDGVPLWPSPYESPYLPPVQSPPLPWAAPTDEGTASPSVSIAPPGLALLPATLLPPAPRPLSPGPPASAAPALTPRIGGLTPLSGAQILANARALLGIRYVWGGNTLSGLDCSAFVSRAWVVSRHTTDTLSAVAYPISRDELLPGDALNLTTRQDPR